MRALYIEKYQFADGTFTFNTLINQIIFGTSANDTLNGDIGNDNIYGADGNDLLYGDAGNDLLYGQNGHDYLYGGDGDDRLSPGSGSVTSDNLLDYVDGGNGNDILLLDGSKDNYTFTGVATNLDIKDSNGTKRVTNVELIEFSNGTTVSTQEVLNKYVYGTAGNDDLYGGEGKDVIYGFAGNDRVNSYGEDDKLLGGDGNDTLSGFDGNDQLLGENGNDYLYGGLGNDSLYGSLGNDNLDGGDGDDLLDPGSGNDSIDGGAGNNTLILGGFKNYYTFSGAPWYLSISGYSETKTVSNVQNIKFADGITLTTGKALGKSIYGTPGNDILSGEYGDDILNGNDGNDTLTGSIGNDVLYAGNGQDDLDGGEGDDTLWGGSGYKLLRGAAGNDVIYSRDGQGLSGNNKLYGGQGNDTLYGWTGNDSLYGEDGNDSLEGYWGNDVLEGGNGNDVLKGGDGNDVLKAGAGNNTLNGGAGDDTFIIDSNTFNTAIFSGKRSQYTFDRYNISGPDGADTFLGNIQRFQFDDGTYDVYGGKVVDGFIQGGTVFLDANLNGTPDVGEISTTSNQNGQFQLLIDDVTFNQLDTNKNGTIDLSEGRLAMIGGIDSGSELPFEGILTAPVGSATITPFTSLVERLARLAVPMAVDSEHPIQTYSLAGGNLSFTGEDPVQLAKQLILSQWFVGQLILYPKLEVYENLQIDGATIETILDPADTLITDATANFKYGAYGVDYPPYISINPDTGKYEPLEYPQNIDEASKIYLIGAQVQLVSEQLAAFTNKPINEILDKIANSFLHQERIDFTSNGELVDELVSELPTNLKMAATLAVNGAVNALTHKALDYGFVSKTYNLYDKIFSVNAKLQAVGQELQDLLGQIRRGDLQISVKEFNENFSTQALLDRFDNSIYQADNIFPPQTADFSRTLTEDTVYTFAVTNFPFTKGDENDTLKSVIIETTPRQGTLKLKDQVITSQIEVSVADIDAGLLTFTPDANGFGDNYAQFSFRVSDGKFFSDELHLATITVNSVNDIPVAQDDAATTTEDTAVDINVLTNDRDIENNSLSLAIATSPTHGTAKINDNGTPDNQQDDFIRYLPLADFAGIDVFTYEIDDGNGGKDTATVNITVNAKPVTVTQTPTEASHNLIQFAGNANQAKLEITLTNKQVQPLTVHEVGVFAVEDDQGRVQGLLPGDAGYIQAALQTAQVIFSVLPDDFIANPSRILSNLGGKRLGFYLVQNGTTDEILNNPSTISKVLLGSSINPTSSTLNIKTTNQTNQFQLDFKLQGDRPVLSLLLNPTDIEQPIGSTLQGQREKELVDLTQFIGKTVKAFFPIVASEAAYDNTVGFYRIENTQGTVIDPLTGQSINLGDIAYTQAALRNSRSQSICFNDQSAGISGTWQGGHLYAPFIIANGTLDQALANNSTLPVYFAYSGVNPDKMDHIRLLGNNTWGFEDLPGGGDFDFNDIVIQAQFTVTNLG
ncbi:Ig-like domain-containing protein [Nostoc sp. 'Peltigera malacea cyanobiont' DB3992]|uniref:Ig-like domain-containing protein n=1 Tax=Nostoc sp. 'Peltigera malacea cyanobiont' DB3992 TaxID=1206980 RepID=UPI000C04A4F6|nr:Ig-like domain-containing protein [Nostoc sp. 'Peltigera malacea cyanobiont' DB3992]PHM10327.1 hypothetical protein CK516_09225 [Nostoc sp. 'Peltigera malacea cyanobiont' DB3992]